MAEEGPPSRRVNLSGGPSGNPQYGTGPERVTRAASGSPIPVTAPGAESPPTHCPRPGDSLDPYFRLSYLPAQLLDLDGAEQFKWVFETHDHWIQSADCKLPLDRIASPEFSALWDMGHTSRVGGEDPADSLAALGDRVCYDGYVMFEHEKRWHAELEEPEEIFPLFMQWFNGLAL